MTRNKRRVLLSGVWVAAVVSTVSCGSDTTEQKSEWVSIAAGSFDMGCEADDADCGANERPQHTVQIKPFQIQRTEVTQAQYAEQVGENPSFFQPPDPSACPECPQWEACPNCPVEQVSWREAGAYCASIGGRLPTEAEWEYAARANTSARYLCGDTASCLPEVAWYNVNAESRTHRVAGKRGNVLGLHDMLGNVWEWTADAFVGDYAGAPTDGSAVQGPADAPRVLRGGGWYFGASNVRTTARLFYSPSYSAPHIGFRCVKSAR